MVRGSFRSAAYSRVVDEHERLRSSWIANASAWSDAVRNQRIESRRVVTDAAIVAAVLEQNPSSVLDLGCGEGWLARALSARGLAVTGVDASEPLIRAAEELGGGRFVVAGYRELIEHPALLQSTFDAIVANFSLLDDVVAELLKALTAVLAEEGHLIVQTVHPFVAVGDGPYADGWRTESFAGFPGEWQESMPWYFRTLESWTRVVADGGFVIREIREPMHPDRALPASLILVCRRA